MRSYTGQTFEKMLLETESLTSQCRIAFHLVVVDVFKLQAAGYVFKMYFLLTFFIKEIERCLKPAL